MKLFLTYFATIVMETWYGFLRDNLFRGLQGQGIREGVCESTCDRLYQTCKYDLFSYDPNHPDRLVPCKRDTLFCSKLKDIIPDNKKFCPLLGHKINPKTQYDDSFLVNLASNLPIEPACYDMTPSSAIWGRVTPDKKSAVGLKFYVGLMFIYIVYLIM